MGLYERDYLKRQLEKLALLVARALGLRRAGQNEEAERLLAEASGELLGIDLDVLDALDAQSVARLLRPRGGLRIYAELERARAQLADEAGDQLVAAARRERADALFAELEAEG